VTAVDVRGLGVRLAGRDVLRDVSLAVPSGGWLGIIGPNGAGKTTLLRAVAGLVPSSGAVLLDGTPAAGLAPRERARRIAIVAQRPVLPAAMTVSDYVLLGRTPYIAYFDTETASDLEVVVRSLERLGIAPYAARALGTLSGGEQQRVVLARAVAQQAPVLLLDEGTSALDVGAQQDALELVESLRRTEGLTVVTAMHDLTLAGQFAEEVALLSGGSIVAAGRPEVVLDEDLILEHYGARVRVSHGPDGTVVSPVRRGVRAEEVGR
jgi:iron complex transport system ATP-binding protein